MKWLSYHPDRRRPWTEHDCFPKGSIKYLSENTRKYRPNALLIFELSDDRTKTRRIPESEWPE